MFNISISKLLTIMPVSNVIKQRGISIEAPGFRVPIVVSDIPHQAIELFDSKLNTRSILLSLQVIMMQVINYHQQSRTLSDRNSNLRGIYYVTFAMNWFLEIDI